MGWADLLIPAGDTGVLLDLTDAPPGTPEAFAPALAELAALEAGAIANPSEGRQVGHYWLRNPAIAPDPAVAEAIRAGLRAARAVSLGPADTLLIVGIGGSALGPQLLADALARPADRVRLAFLDNTDPEGFARVLAGLDPRRTVVAVVSKSGGTVETHNGMQAAIAWKSAAGLAFAPDAIAVTCAGSRLDRRARAEGWRAVLPLWDWVGGRTSITGAVGWLPFVACGWDLDAFLGGAAAMDAATRDPAPARNPAVRLAAAWAAAGNGRGDRALVVLPYRDRLALLGRYLQQLVMESLGKRTDRAGRVVHQGLTVYGNKGSTDQHAFVQQVRDGRDDTFTHFVETLVPDGSFTLDDGFDAADHLLGFARGTRAALAEAGRPSCTLILPDAGPAALGATLALFERAVGLYAAWAGLNAYDQPGVEAGKRAAAGALDALARLRAALGPTPRSVDALAKDAGVEPLLAWRLLDHLAATGRAVRGGGFHPDTHSFHRS